MNYHWQAKGNALADALSYITTPTLSHEYWKASPQKEGGPIECTVTRFFETVAEIKEMHWPVRLDQPLWHDDGAFQTMPSSSLRVALATETIRCPATSRTRERALSFCGDGTQACATKRMLPTVHVELHACFKMALWS